MELTDILNGFLSWAWERHHNVLSWYIRPLFILPLAYFSYRRSISGIEGFLAFERKWLTGEWTTEKIVSAMIPPLILGVMCLAFWKRSLTWGLVVINAMAVTKLLWGVIDDEGSG
jgi:hypothetical protein